MKENRQSGILLHPTSLPSSWGIGTIGKEAFRFVDFLKEADQTLWQMLPLGPTGYGDSPYASFSTFAGNPLLIDLDDLLSRGWAKESDIQVPPYIKKEGNVDYGAVVWWKMPLLKKIAHGFVLSGADKEKFEAFKIAESSWLDDYADFTSIKDFYDKKANEEGISGKAQMWNAYWDKNLSLHDEESVKEWRKAHAEEIEDIKAIQFFFSEQWTALKKYASEKGVSIIGDIPIFVAPDSADVWGNQKLFQLTDKGLPKFVAGVPPDYFSATGQLWGNPLYDWKEMEKDEYAWWVARLKRIGELVDIVRIDHFRGFEAYWSVPYGSENAIKGEWKKGPGMKLFDKIKKELPQLKVIAEDLGIITDEVRELLKASGFPGMKVLQFAFDPNEAGKEGMVNAFLPHMYTKNSVVYTGTHDNETMQGWLEGSPIAAVKIAAEYAFGRKMSEEEAKRTRDDKSLCAALVRAALASVACLAVIPMQDVLALGNEARMNTPSTLGTNWMWRMKEGELGEEIAKNLSFISSLYGRNIGEAK